MSRIFDVVTYNGEAELFEIRYNILKDSVDEFRVIEFDKTFSGQKKEKQFNQNYPKVKHYFVTEDKWKKYENLAWQSPNTLGAEHWKREFMMKESIKDCLTDLDDENIVMVGDCDEIPDMDVVLKWCHAPFKWKMKVYTYWLNNKSSENFWGFICSPYKFIKNNCLNDLRNNAWKTIMEGGWHFTSIGGYDKVKEKLTDSYTDESYATKQVLDNLEDNIKSNKDFLGRDFKYKIDESEWPQFLKDNKEKYKHLLK